LKGPCQEGKSMLRFIRFLLLRILSAAQTLNPLRRSYVLEQAPNPIQAYPGAPGRVLDYYMPKNPSRVQHQYPQVARRKSRVVSHAKA